MRWIRTRKNIGSISGLSVIDLLITLSLMAILAGAVPATLAPVFDELNVERTKQQLLQIRNAMVGDIDKITSGSNRGEFGYVGNVGALPTVARGGISALLTKPAALSNYAIVSTTRLGAGWNGPYLPSVFGLDWTKDAWGTALAYNPTATPATLTSYGADRLPGGSGPDSDIVVEIPTTRQRFNLYGVVSKAGGGSWTLPTQVELNDLNGSGGSSTSLVTLSGTNTFSFSNVSMGRRSVTLYVPTKASATSTYGPFIIYPSSNEHLATITPTIADSLATIEFDQPTSVESEGSTANDRSLSITMSAVKSYDVEVEYTVQPLYSTLAYPAGHNVQVGTVTIPAGGLSANIEYETYGNFLADATQSKALQIALTGTNSTMATFGFKSVHRQLLQDDDGGLDPFSVAASGSLHVCGIKSSGKLWCWGLNQNSQLGDGSTVTRVSPIAVDASNNFQKVQMGYYHSCGITTAGALRCWGFNGQGQLGRGNTSNSSTPVTINSGTQYKAITGGERYSCAIRSDDKLYCWGQNADGSVGDGTSTQRTSPVAIDSSATYSTIDAGFYRTTCGITLTPVANQLKCWGLNSEYQLANGTVTSSNTPVVVDSAVSYSQVSVGSGHVCAITTANKLRCWGRNSSNNLGDNSTTLRQTPVTIDNTTNYQVVSAGTNHTCAITTAGVLKCWGNNGYGQLGDGSFTNMAVPKVINAGVTYQSIALGENHTCAVTTSNLLQCWGRNYDGYLGEGFRPLLTTPNSIDSSQVYATGDSMSASSCAILASGGLRCWGLGSSYRLGNGTLFNQAAPTTLDPGTSYQSVCTGTSHGCGVTTSGGLRCWGAGGSGQIGDGTTATSTQPKSIDTSTTYTRVSCGTNFSCGLTNTGSVKCWGQNNRGQIGDGTAVNPRLSPTVVTGGDTYTFIAAGHEHACGVTKSEELKCWGYNLNGTLGNGNTTSSSSPVTADSGTTYQAVAAGVRITCGLTTDNTIRCWGYNRYGSMGNRTVNTVSPYLELTPQLVDSGSKFKAVSVGDYHVCGISSGDQLKCWGYNNSFRLGDNTQTNRTTPVVINSGVTYQSVFMSKGDGAGVGCAVTTAGLLQCWGRNESLLMGEGTLKAYPLPIW